ncbi:unnamed protein product [Blepharisma stoltei]|uniref:Uncharacterized protein n=1 Tax=Blepharisma stoltei TaxID=1481888 RepID=A0AAU9KP99_9CILI|nr:unnamed protein product [Blepharisma stoltei]
MQKPWRFLWFWLSEVLFDAFDSLKVELLWINWLNCPKSWKGGFQSMLEFLKLSWVTEFVSFETETLNVEKMRKSIPATDIL